MSAGNLHKERCNNSLGRLLKQAHGLTPLVDEVLDYRDDLVNGVSGGVDARRPRRERAARPRGCRRVCRAALRALRLPVDLGLELLGGERLTSFWDAAARGDGRAVSRGVGGQEHLDLRVGEYDGAGCRDPRPRYRGPRRRGADG